jgi:hypothetical protein
MPPDAAAFIDPGHGWYADSSGIAWLADPPLIRR